MRPELLERYRLRSKLAVHRRVVERAHECIQRAMSEHPGVWAVGASGGKDSTALVSVAVEAGWQGPLFHFRSGLMTPPENTGVVRALGDHFGLAVDVVDVPGVLDAFDAAGFFLIPETGEQKSAASAARRSRKGAVGGFAGSRYAGIFWGMRADESRARSMVVGKFGDLYRAQTRAEWTALPLARWTDDDVWARLTTAGLPWLDRYDIADDPGRERSEVTWLACPELWRRGQGQRLRRADPAEWQRLVARWPGLRRYG